MKQYPIYALLLSIILCSCGKSPREQIVDEVKVFKNAILKNNKQQVAGFFSFPITNIDLRMKAEVTGDQEVKIARLDKKAFLKHYKRIVPQDFNTLFRYLNVDDFKDLDRMEKTVIPNEKSSQCYEGYEVVIERNEITFTFYTNPRTTTVSYQEEMVCPQYAESWTFELIDGKLQFKNLGIAG
jgi:hypothetical protein